MKVHMNSRFPASACITAVVFSLAACETPSRPVAPDGMGSSLVYSAGLTNSIDVLATGIAAAMQDHDIRRAIRDGMRASPYVEHKLVLHDWLESNPSVFAAVAAATGIAPAELRNALREAGALDFYAPVLQHRRTWRATPNVQIGYTLDPDFPDLTTISPDGKRGYHKVDDIQEAVLVLHPAEPKDIRTHRQPDTPGEVIQDADDGGPGGLLIVRDKSGKVIREEPVAVERMTINECVDCDTNGGGGTSTTTVLERFIVYYQDGVGSAEVEYTIWDDTHNVTVRFTDIQKDQVYIVNKSLWSGVLSNALSDNVSLVETDAFSDDFWGYGTVTSNDNGIWKAVYGHCEEIGDPNTDLHPECQSPPYITLTSELIVSWY